MNKSLPILKVLSLVLAILLTASVLNGQKIASVDGPWNSAATWGGAAPPTAADDVIINNGIDVTVTAAGAACASITFGSAAGSLTVDAGFTLAVTNAITLQNTAATSTAATLAGAGTITCASITVGGNVTLVTGDALTNILTTTIANLTVSGVININGEDNAAAESSATFSIGSGTVTVGGIITLDSDTDGADAAAVITMDLGADNGLLNVASEEPFAIAGTGGTETFDFAGGTVTYNSPSDVNQFIFPATYENLVLTNPSVGSLGFKNAPASFTVNGTLTVNADALLNPDAAAVISGTSNTITGTGFILSTRLGADAYTGQFVFTTDDLDEMIVGFGGAGNQTVDQPGIYGSLRIGNGGIKTLSVDVTVNNDVRITENTVLDPLAQTITLATGALDIFGTVDFSNEAGSVVASGASLLTMAPTGLIRTSDPAGLGPAPGASLVGVTIANIATAGTVEYYRAVTSGQTITDMDYNKLMISGATQVKTWTLAAARTINDTITIGTDAPLTVAGAFALNIKRDWIKNSTAAFIPGPAIYSFNGTVLQNIGGSAPTTFGSVAFGNTLGVDLDQPVTITTDALFTAGPVTGDATNLLIFDAGATVTGGSSDASFVEGPVRKSFNSGESFIFPVGVVGTGNEPLTIAGITAAGYTFTANYSRTGARSLDPDVTAPILNVSLCDHWVLDKNAGPATGVNVTISWDASSICSAGPFVTNPATLTVAHLAGGTWQQAGTASGGFTGTPAAGTVTRNNVTTFSPFSLGNTGLGDNPLPVRFVDVRAYEKGTGVQIDWSNLTESNLLKYVVERSSNGQTFTPIAEQLPRSNNDVKESYSKFDASPLAGTNFYRISAMELSGKIFYSKILRVDIGANVDVINIYPNPVRDKQLSVYFNLTKGKYAMRIYNSVGQEIVSKQFNHQGGSITQTIDLPATASAGVYTLFIHGDSNRESRKFIVE